MPHYPEHLRNFEYTGPNRYFLTFCTWERVRHFTNVDHVALVCEQFQRASREQDFAVIAYCFMPDHVHLLVDGDREDADLKRFTSSRSSTPASTFDERPDCSSGSATATSGR
jgi:REP element-mobilizing transposase RayT